MIFKNSVILYFLLQSLLLQAGGFIPGVVLSGSMNSGEEVQGLNVGDSVLSYNDEHQEAGTVVETGVEEAFTLSLSTASGEIAVAYRQQLMTPSGWARAVDLQEGDEVLMLDGFEAIESVLHNESLETVHTLVVLPHHSFYVNGFLLHNGWANWDPFNKNSEVRKGARAIDPTVSGSAIRRLSRAVDPCNSQNHVQQTVSEMNNTERVAVGVVTAAVGVVVGLNAVSAAKAIASGKEASIVASAAGVKISSSLNEEEYHSGYNDSAPSSRPSSRTVGRASRSKNIEYKPKSYNADVEYVKQRTGEVLSDSAHLIRLSAQQLSPRSQANRCGFDYRDQGVEEAEDGTSFMNPVSFPKTAVGKASKNAYKVAKQYSRDKNQKQRDTDSSVPAVEMTSRAARREAMRQGNVPTSKSAASQLGSGDRRQYINTSAHGENKVVTHHLRDKDHSNSHWHVSDPKMHDNAMRMNNHGQIKYEDVGKSTVEYKLR